MKKLSTTRWFNRSLLTIAALLLTFLITLMNSSEEYAYSQPTSPWFPSRATITEIINPDGFRGAGQVVIRRNRPSANSNSEEGRKGLNVNAYDFLRITQKSVKLLFSDIKRETVVGGDLRPTPTTYIFPNKAIGGKPGVRWNGQFDVGDGRKAQMKVFPLKQPVSRVRSNNSTFSKNLIAQANLDFPQGIIINESIPIDENQGEIRFCSAMSDFSVIPDPVPEYGKAWGVGISSRGFDILSQNDPCRRALQDCESEAQNLRRVANPKLGTRCSIVNSSVQILDDFDVIVSLDCSGNEETPFKRVFYSESVKAAQIDDEFIDGMKRKARRERAKSCIFDIDLNVPNSRIITPDQSAGEVVVKIDVTGDTVEVLTSKGSVEVRPINPEERTKEPPRIVPEKNKYFYSSEDPQDSKYKVVRVSDPEVDEARRNQPLILLRPVGGFFRRGDTIGLMTASGKRIDPWEKLGFSLIFPREWKAITERNDLEIVLDRIQAVEPPLAVTYVGKSLEILKRRDPLLGSAFEAEVAHYLSPETDTRFSAFDFDDLASVMAEKRLLNPGISFEKFAEDYAQQIKRTRSSVLKYISHKPLQINGFKAWKVKTRINMLGSFGAPARGYTKEPQIGAGQTVFIEGTNGKPVNLIQTTYLINWENTYFKLDFITTDNRDERYSDQLYKDILNSFQITEATS